MDSALVSQFRTDFLQIQQEISKVIVGYQDIITQVLICFLAGGHVLLEGVPGLGKTLLVRTLAEVTDLPFARIQFTPDLMPSDIIGTNLIVEEATGQRTFRFHRGPVFSNIVLADEINRATPKTQSALLECMQEKSVTVTGTLYHLDEPFFLLATQNPLEMEGTYPLPEAQLDRFFFKLLLPYPSRETLNEILQKNTQRDSAHVQKIGSKVRLLEWMKMVRDVYVAPPVQDYATRLILSTHPHATEDKMVKGCVRYGASPRGAITLVLAAKIEALLQERYNVSFDDIRKFAQPALRHRIILQFAAEAEGLTTDHLIEQLLATVPCQ